MSLVTTPLFKKLTATVTCTAAAAAVYLGHTPEAKACGCFAPPDPSVPIVQAGERIVFAVEDGNVVAHIQIQYSGAAEEFAWLVPVPAVPELGLGTQELFAQIINTTQPKYRVNREYLGSCSFDPSRGGFGVPASDSAGGEPSPEAPDSPLVLRQTVGPFDTAVLRADDQQEMLTWLNDNGFFVPAGTDEAVTPYIRPGSFFLALRLLKGNDVGDIQPIVLRYESQLPMIPIVLTSVAAEPDMGVQVWVLGESRAIPRNFFHTLVNDAAVDWLNAGANYVDVVTRAVDEAERHHSFVTEYAGTSSIMRDVLDYPSRFGNPEELAQISNAIDYVEYLTFNGFSIPSNQPPFFFQFTPETLAVLDGHLPVPSALAESGVTPDEYYGNFRFFITQDRFQRPELYTDLDLDFVPADLTAELEQRVIAPSREAGKLFRDHPYMTRMFTTLSPNEMNRDPVFSFNPDLPDVSNIHEARLIYHCSVWGSEDQGTTPAELITEQGWRLSLPNGESDNPWLAVDMPASRFTQVLREEGDAETVRDNSNDIESAIEANTEDGGLLGGCTASSGTGGAVGMLLGLFALVVVRRRRA